MAGRDTDKIADEFDLKRRPYATAIIHKHAGIVRELLNPFSETSSQQTAPSSDESANHQFLSGGAYHCGRLIPSLVWAN